LEVQHKDYYLDKIVETWLIVTAIQCAVPDDSFLTTGKMSFYLLLGSGLLSVSKQTGIRKLQGLKSVFSGKQSMS